MEQINMKVPKELKEALKKIAKDEKYGSVTELAREILREGLKSRGALA